MLDWVISLCTNRTLCCLWW